MEAQTNGTKLSQKMKPHIYSQLISNKDVKVDKKERYFQCKKMDMNMQKKSDLWSNTSTTKTKINSKSMRSKYKIKMIKYSEINIEKM